jgi:hypothetical protein
MRIHLRRGREWHVGCFTGMNLQPEHVLPSQLDRRTLLLPEQRLMLAVLEDAVSCMQRYAHPTRRRERRVLTEAQQWIFSDDESWPFSCVNVCAALDIDLAYLRLGLVRWADRAQKGAVSLVPYRARRQSGSRTRTTLGRPSARSRAAIAARADRTYPAMEPVYSSSGGG